MFLNHNQILLWLIQFQNLFLKIYIIECLTHTHDQYQAELDTLLTLNFQTFDNLEKVNFVPV